MDIKKYGKEILIGAGAGVAFHYWAADKIDTLCMDLVSQAQGLINRGACIPQTQGWDLWIIPLALGIGGAILLGVIYDKVWK